LCQLFEFWILVLNLFNSTTCQLLQGLAVSLLAGLREVQADSIKFYSQAKNQHFRPSGATHCTDSRKTWHGLQAHVSAWLCKNFTSIGAGGGNPAPKKYINFHFLIKDVLRRPAVGAKIWCLYVCIFVTP